MPLSGLDPAGPLQPDGAARTSALTTLSRAGGAGRGHSYAAEVRGRRSAGRQRGASVLRRSLWGEEVPRVSRRIPAGVRLGCRGSGFTTSWVACGVACGTDPDGAARRSRLGPNVGPRLRRGGWQQGRRRCVERSRLAWSGAASARRWPPRRRGLADAVPRNASRKTEAAPAALRCQLPHSFPYSFRIHCSRAPCFKKI